MTVSAHGLSGSAQYERALKLVLALTSTYLAVETVGGLLTHSLALLADAAHMLTDVGGLALGLMAIRVGRRPATPTHTYGFYRAEILAAIVNGVTLLAISGYILFEAWQRFLHPQAIATSGMLLISVVGLGVNIAGVRLLGRGSGDSLNVRGTYLELLSDLVSSVGVIVAAVIIRTTGWLPADPLLSAGIGLFIIPRTWRLLREAGSVLLEGTPADVDLAKVRAMLLTIDGVLDVHDLHAWSLTSGVHAMSVHVVRRADANAEAILANVQQMVPATCPIRHVTVQIEPEGWDEGDTHL